MTLGLLAAAAAGGALGACGRWFLGRYTAGTWAANTAACAIVGWATTAGLAPHVSALLVLGGAGALSTWSTLAKELGQLASTRPHHAAAYFLITVATGLVAFVIGAHHHTWVVGFIAAVALIQAVVHRRVTAAQGQKPHLCPQRPIQ